MQESVGPNQQVVSCSWVGEVQEDEEGQLFSSKLRTDIKDLNKFSPDTGVTQLIGIFIKTAMGVMGTFALVIFIYGGINWMLARGDSDMQRKGFDTLVWGALGIAVMLSSYALADYIFEAFR